MKQLARTLAAALLTSAMAWAQAGTPAGSSTPPPAKPSGQQATPAQGAPAPGASPAAPSPAKQPQAKSQEEYAAFMATINKENPAEAEQAAREFEVKYPDSELLSMLYQAVMSKYQRADNADKTVEMGRRALHYNPDNTVALVMTGLVLAERTRETDIDRDEKLNEAMTDAKHALQNIQENKFQLAPSATPEQIEGFKNTVRFMANAALGQAELVKKNDAAAEGYFRSAVATQQGQLDAITWLRLSLALDHQNKYPDALQAADKAVELSASNPSVATLAKTEQSRLRQLTGSGAASGAPSTPPPPPNQPQTQTVPR